MQIILYNLKADKKLLDKTQITPIFEKTIDNCVLKESTEIITPVLNLVRFDGIFSCNYAFIPDFNRYYFINEISVERGNICNISLECDVLTSFKDDIKNLKVIACRSSNRYNRFLVDSMIPAENNVQVNVRRLSTGLFQSNLLTNDTRCFAITVLSRKAVAEDANL